MKEELEDLILANHILHYNQVLDAYGHVSIRHPENPDIFIMSASLAPALVSSPSSLIQYAISDASPVTHSPQKGYQERFIHSEIYKRYPAINGVIHSHAEAVLPYTMSGVSLKPVFHIAGFLGTHVPNYDILPLYKAGDTQDMLVNNSLFGAELASKFSSSSTSTSPSPSSPSSSSQHDHNVVLMSNHGFTAIGTSLKQAVYRAIYTRVNASVQSQAMMLRSAASGSGSKHYEMPEMRFLDTQEQTEGCMKMNDASQERPWELWVKEVQVCGLYEIDLEKEK